MDSEPTKGLAAALVFIVMFGYQLNFMIYLMAYNNQQVEYCIEGVAPFGQ